MQSSPYPASPTFCRIPSPSALQRQRALCTKQIGKRVENENKCEYLSDLYAGTLQLQMWNMPKSGVCAYACVCVCARGCGMGGGAFHLNMSVGREVIHCGV